MSVVPTPSWGSSLFCDDIRREIQGTTSLIGVYSNVMFVWGDFPFQIPKFCVFVKFVEAAAELGKSCTLAVSFPGDSEPSYKQEIPLPEDREGISTPHIIYDATLDKRFIIQVPIIFSPFIVKEEGPIKVRMYGGGKEYRIGAITIRKGDATSPTNAFAPPS